MTGFLCAYFCCGSLCPHFFNLKVELGDDMNVYLRYQHSGGSLSIFALFILVWSFLFLVEGVRGILRGLQSVNWPVVNATVVSSEIVEVKSGGGDTVRYQSKIHFEYEVDGLLIVNSDGAVALNNGDSLSWSKAHTVVKRFPIGKRVDICYYPKRIDVACVASEAGLSLTPFLCIISSSMFLYYGLMILKMA